MVPLCPFHIAISLSRTEMTDREFFEGLDSEQKVLRADSRIRENLRCGYQQDLRFEEQVRRIDEIGNRALAIINSI